MDIFDIGMIKSRILTYLIWTLYMATFLNQGINSYPWLIKNSWGFLMKGSSLRL